MKRNRFVFITILICLFALVATSCQKPFAGSGSSYESKTGSSNVSAESSSSSSSSVSSSQAASSSDVASSGAAAQQAQQSAAQAASTAAHAAAQTPAPAAPAAPAAPSWPASGAVPGAYYVPNIDGQRVFSNSAAYIDLSYTSYGFVKIHLLQASASRVKVWIHSSGDYYYDLKTDGSTEIFPLQMGSGSYTVSVMQNVSGSSYSYLASTSVSVGLNRSDAPFLVPSQIVNYAGTSAPSIARSLVSGKTNNYERISAVCDYVASHIHYNYALAKSVQSGYVPNIESDISSGSGICYDYAAVAAGMLRSLGYPTKLIMGNANGTYHAWNEVYISGQGWIKVMSVTLNTSEWSRVDCTFISTSTSPAAVAQFIQNGGNYNTEKVY